MVCGYLPFEDEDGESKTLYAKIMAGQYEWPDKIFGFSEQLTSLMKGILNTNPSSRFDVQQIIRHSWVSKFGNNGQDYYCS